MMLLKCCNQYASKFGKLSSDHRTGKGQYSFQSQRKETPKNCTIALISFTSKVMLTILQARLQQYVNWKLPDVQAGFRKGRRTIDQIVNICCIIKKARESRRTSTSALLTMPKPLTVWITTNWKILEEIVIPDHLTCLLRNLYTGQEATVRTRHGTMDCLQIGEEVHPNCHTVYLTSMQIACEMPGWMKHKLESILLGYISITSDIQMTPLFWQKLNY